MGHSEMLGTDIVRVPNADEGSGARAGKNNAAAAADEEDEEDDAVAIVEELCTVDSFTPRPSSCNITTLDNESTAAPSGGALPGG